VTFGEVEVAYILEGEVVVTPKGGEPVAFGTGDLVTFRPGCHALGRQEGVAQALSVG